MTYPLLNAAPLRTGETFNQMNDKNHHCGPTPLIKTEVNLEFDFVLDYMHLVCLGVVRKLVMIWICGPLKSRQSHSVICQVSEHLVQFRQYTPAEFARKPRNLTEVKHRKATEFPMFLLYTGPVVLKRKVSTTIVPKLYVAFAWY